MHSTQHEHTKITDLFNKLEVPLRKGEVDAL